MDSGPPASGKKKMRFGPKPLRQVLQPTITEIAGGTEKEADDQEIQALLSRRFHEDLQKQNARPEKKSPAQVAFTHEGSSGSLTAIRTFGIQTGETFHGSATDNLDEFPRDQDKALVASGSADKIRVDGESSERSTDIEEECKKNWYAVDSYRPTTLPWKDPSLENSGKSEQAAESEEQSTALELGLLDKDDTKNRMIFFQFPPTLPFVGNQISATEADGKLKDIEKSEGCRLEEIPEGLMGKLLVYKSGSVKLKLGDVLLNVSPGMKISNDQIIMAMNTSSKDCTSLGGVDSRAVVSVDVDSV